jgi:hypothetical protein
MDPKLKEQYFRDTPMYKHYNLPESREGYWWCECGQMNLQENKKCIICHKKLAEQITATRLPALQQGLDSFIKLSSEQEQMRKRNRKKGIFLALIAAVAVIVLVAVVIFIINPRMKDEEHYQNMIALIADGNYSAAKAEGEMIQYRDISSELYDIDLYSEYADSYQEANKLASLGQHQSAQAIYQALPPEYEDVSTRLETIEHWSPYTGVYVLDPSVSHSSSGDMLVTLVIDQYGDPHLLVTGGSPSPSNLQADGLDLSTLSMRQYNLETVLFDGYLTTRSLDTDHFWWFNQRPDGYYTPQSLDGGNFRRFNP